MKKNVDFYNKESRLYSEKRYLGPTDNFIKYFFRRRLSILLEFVKREASGHQRGLSLLDIGCADGFVMREICDKNFRWAEKFTGIDTSPQMVERAVAKYGADKRFSFFVRGEEPREKYDIVVEIGVPLSDWREEFRYVLSKLKDDGVYIFSTPGSKNSLYSRIKKDFHVENPMSFKEFDSLVSEFFEVKRVKNYAFFVPFLWRFPRIARIKQPFFEAILGFVFPKISHEKIFLLKKKADKPSFKISNAGFVKSVFDGLVLKKHIFFFLVRYLFAGLTSFFTNIFLLFLFAGVLGWWYLYASTLAFAISVLVSFVVQKLVTFRDTTRDKVHYQAGMYVVIALFNICANAVMMLVFVEKFGIPYMFSQVISAGFIAVWSIFVYRFIIFPRGRIY